jgi:DNA-binding PadR family transcriptional regulator
MNRLDYCLLGLIEHGDCSGYDIRKVLTATPMQRYSDSPGSIYPALKRLERAKMIRSLRDVSSPRSRTAYRNTAKGRDALLAWLRQPVTEEEVASRLDEAMLRLSLQHLAGDERATRAFASGIAAASTAHAAKLRHYLRTSTAGFPLGARLAVESGLNTYESIARWAAQAAGGPTTLANTRKRRRTP